VHGSDEAGTPEVYVRSFPDANEKWQISKGNGVDPRWRADGKAFLVNLPVGSNASRPINVLLNWQATLKH